MFNVAIAGHEPTLDTAVKIWNDKETGLLTARPRGTPFLQKAEYFKL